MHWGRAFWPMARPRHTNLPAMQACNCMQACMRRFAALGWEGESRVVRHLGMGIKGGAHLETWACEVYVALGSPYGMQVLAGPTFGKGGQVSL